MWWSVAGLPASLLTNDKMPTVIHHALFTITSQHRSSCSGSAHTYLSYNGPGDSKGWGRGSVGRV